MVGTPPPVVAPAAPVVVPPKRGGIHPVYGLYIGGSPLGDDYKPKKEARVMYRFSSQRRNVKTISSIESALVNARDTITNLKFDGRLEATHSLRTSRRLQGPSRILFVVDGIGNLQCICVT
jgi:hypothetical protein